MECLGFSEVAASEERDHYHHSPCKKAPSCLKWSMVKRRDVRDGIYIYMHRKNKKTSTTT